MTTTKFKELKITQRFLLESGLDVPRDLLLQLSQMIADEDKRLREHRINRMSDEELAAWDSKSAHSVRVTTVEGLLIRGRSNMETFRYVLEHIGLDEVNTLQLKIGKRPVVIVNPKRKRISGYIAIRPGYFVLKEKSSENIGRILREIDQRLRLNLDIEFV